MATNCLRCDGSDWFEYGHWRICRNCDPKFIEGVLAGLTEPVAFKPTLFDRGVPSKPGGK